MDSSDTFFWQTSNVSNGTDQQIIPNSMDGFIQPNQVIASEAEANNSPKTSMVQTQVSSPQNIYEHATESSSGSIVYKAKEEVVTASVERTFPELVNPDAIEPKPRSYTCRICQQTFPNKSAVTVHSRLHTDHQGKPYRCNFCAKGFSTNFYLKQHERIHSGQKPYKCPMCDNSFKQLSHVQQHVRTHTGVRPYKCHWPGCGKAFLQQSHLKSHEARHQPKPSSGVKPFKCHWPDCGKSFAQLTNLKSHVARHTPGKAKSRKSSSNNNAAKKAETPTDQDSAAFNFQNVINQAAAAANIVPAPADEESEIRPYLCPGCSKLYVREATFKKHLEECKTKLQMSISATASALGIDPPPIPSSSSALSEFDPNMIQIISMSTASSSASQQPREDSIPVGEPAKRPRLDPGAKDRRLEEQRQHEAVVSLSGVLVKQEPGLTQDEDVKHFMARHGGLQHSQHPEEPSGDYKLPQIVDSASDSTSIYTVKTATSQHHQQQQQHIPVENVIFQIGNADPKQQQQHLQVSSQSTGLQQQQSHLQQQQQQQQTIIFSTADLRTDNGSSNQLSAENLSQTPTILLAQPQPVVSGPSMGKDSSDQGHSTINQAAIRWQWDQASVPRLNFP